MTPRFVPQPLTRRRRGFSFAEVMFAVMLLGIGFIMVAAIFPVAIRQQQASMEDTAGVVTAKRGAAVVQQMGLAFAQYNPAGGGAFPGNYANLIQDDPATVFGTATPVTPAKSRPVLVRFQAVSGTGTAPYHFVKGDMIQASDRRLAWMPVAYASALGSQYAQVYVCAVQVRTHDQFTATDIDSSDTVAESGPFLPVDVYFKLVEGGTVYPDTVVFTDAAGSIQEVVAAAEGAYIWVADDNVTAIPGTPGLTWVRPGAANGRFYRLGVKRDDLGFGVWELQPGDDMDVTRAPGPNGTWDTTTPNDDEFKNENLPPRLEDSPHPVATGNYAALPGPPARGLLVGRGATPGTTTRAGTAMSLFALPPVTVRIQP